MGNTKYSSPISSNGNSATSQIESHQAPAWSTRLYTMLCGLCMGGADVIPGVSGGTIALIMGIYEKLVHNLADIKARTVLSAAAGLATVYKADGRRRLGAALAELHIWFFGPLLAGILTAVITVIFLLEYLLYSLQVPELVFGFFFGLILASIPIPYRHIKDHSAKVWVFTVFGAVFAFWVTGLNAAAVAAPSLPYIFLCGTIAISAMILPGISGSFFLLILGVYFTVTGAVTQITGWLKGLVGGGAGELPGYELAMLVTLVAGILVGLFSFVKLLRWLMDHHHDWTMAFVTGLMIGGLRSLWPFKEWPQPLTKESMRGVIPTRLPQDGDIWIFVWILAGVVLLLGLNVVSRRFAGNVAHTHAR